MRSVESSPLFLPATLTFGSSDRPTAINSILEQLPWMASLVLGPAEGLLLLNAPRAHNPRVASF